MRTPTERSTKFRWYLWTAGYFFGGYYVCQWVSAHRAVHWTLYLPGERALPFVPMAVFGYTLSYAAMFLIYFLFEELPAFRRLCRLAFWVMTVHFCCFLTLPFHFERPAIATDDLSSLVTRFYYWIDRPYNVFPSLHVSFPFLGGLALWNHRRRWAIAFFLMTIVVMVSVVLVKQHFILDTIAAVGVTTAVFIISKIRSARDVKSPVLTRLPPFD